MISSIDLQLKCFSLSEAKKEVASASRGKMDLAAVWKEFCGQPVGSYIIRELPTKPNVRQICYLNAERRVKRISLIKKGPSFEAAGSKRKFASLAEVILDPELAPVLTHAVKRPLPKELFHNPATITLEPIYPSNPEKDRKAFETMKAKLSDNKDVRVTFDDEAKAITFSHNEDEVHVILFEEQLMNFILGTISLSRGYLTMRGRGVFVVGGDSREQFEAKEKMLQQAARSFLERCKKVEVELLPNIQSSSLIPSLLDGHKGICIGECHSMRAAKKFLIDHMLELKRCNVTTLFMEHLFYDSTQMWLDSYHNGPENSPMPRYLKTYLKLQSDGHRDHDPTYNNTKVIEAAKIAKIRVVAIDTTVSYLAATTDKLGVSDERCHERYRAMNFVAANIILREHGRGKFVALMGSGHVSTVDGQPGVATIVGCPSVVIEDSGNDAPSLTLNVKKLYDRLEQVSAYLRI